MKPWSWFSIKYLHKQKSPETKNKSSALENLQKYISQSDSDTFSLRCRTPLCLLTDVRSPAWSHSQCEGSRVAVCSCRRWPSARLSSTTVREGQRQRRHSRDPPASPWELHRSLPSPLQRTASMQTNLYLPTLYSGYSFWQMSFTYMRNQNNNVCFSLRNHINKEMYSSG